MSNATRPHIRSGNRDVRDKIRDAHSAFVRGNEEKANALLIHASNVNSWNNRQVSNKNILLNEVIKSWWQKTKRAPLTPQEANLQKAVGLAEMGIGGAGIVATAVPTKGRGVYVSLYVMAGGSYIFSEGANGVKAHSFATMFTALVNPVIESSNNFNFVVPYP